MTITRLAGALALLVGLSLSAGRALAATPEEIVGYCTTETTFGERFGATEFKGVPRIAYGPRRAFKPAGDWAPFDRFELGVTPNTGRVHSVTGTKVYPTVAEAKAAAQEIQAAAQASGHFPYQTPDSDPDMPDLTTEDGGGIEFSVFQLGDELSVSCTDTALMALAFTEFFNPVAPETRPAPPVLAMPAPPPTGVCETPDGRDAFLGEIDSRMQDFLSFAQELTGYSEQLMLWKSDQLIKRKVWTKKQSADFGLALLSDKAFMAPYETLMADLMGGMGLALAYGEKLEAGDRTGACRDAVRMFIWMERMTATAQGQWRMIDTRFEAVAKAKGVTLE